MTPREVNLLLVKAAALDPRIGSLIRDGGAVHVAQEWCTILRALTFEDALAAMREHYSQAGARMLLPGDVLERAVPHRESADGLARREWLAARGLTEERLAAMPLAEVEALVRGEGVPGVES